MRKQASTMDATNDSEKTRVLLFKDETDGSRTCIAEVDMTVPLPFRCEYDGVKYDRFAPGKYLQMSVTR